jgi:hypothetical protein
MKKSFKSGGANTVDDGAKVKAKAELKVAKVLGGANPRTVGQTALSPDKKLKNFIGKSYPKAKKMKDC